MVAARRQVARYGCPQRTVGFGAAAVVPAAVQDRVVSAHPRPLPARRGEFPNVVRIAEVTVCVKSIAAEEPQVPLAVSPPRCPLSAPRNVIGPGRAQRPVHSRLSTGQGPHDIVVCNTHAARSCAASAHPGPLVDGWVVFPQFVEVILRLHAHVVRPSAKQPEVSLLVRPCSGTLTSARCIPGRRRAESPIHARLRARVPIREATASDRAAAAHPRPLASGRI